MIDIDSLDWGLPQEIQIQNIKKVQISCDEDVRQLIMPYRKQNSWHNCAVILAKLDNVTILRFLPDLLGWVKDLNWPGADVILERINLLPMEQMQPLCKAAYTLAMNEKDEQWAENLLDTFHFI